MTKSFSLLRSLEIMFEGPINGPKKPPRVAAHKKLGLKTLVGYRGKKGCFSVLPLADGKLDIAIFDSTPEKLDKNKVEDAIYIELDGTQPGWGFSVTNLIKQLEL